jgi:hypothetical protein
MPAISLKNAAAALSFAALSLAMVSCGPTDEGSRAKSGPIVGPFVVSNIFTPSGFMGDGAIPGRLTVGINDHCKMPRPPGAQGDCYHYLYKAGSVKWAGAYWVFPSNSWGTVPGRKVVGPVGPDVLGNNPDTGAPLHGYHYVRFYGAIDPLPNPPSVQYWAGRLDGRKALPPQPYYDTGCSVFPGTPAMCTDTTLDPPTPFAFAPLEESARFTPEWKQYQIDLSKWSVDSLIGAFGWSSNDSDNPGQTQSIYFDDIVWE